MNNHDDTLRVTEEAVRAWADAYGEFAGAVRREMRHAERVAGTGKKWGDLDSILQLEAGYRDRLGGQGNDSLASILDGIADRAERIVARLESNHRSIVDQDDLTAGLLGAGE